MGIKRFTSITRRVDDLGRVIIPKEVRKELNIDAGDIVEVYVDTDTQEVIFKKHIYGEDDC